MDYVTDSWPDEEDDQEPGPGHPDYDDEYPRPRRERNFYDER